MKALPDIRTANKVVELVLEDWSHRRDWHLAGGRRRGHQSGNDQADSGHDHSQSGRLRRFDAHCRRLVASMSPNWC